MNGGPHIALQNIGGSNSKIAHHYGEAVSEYAIGEFGLITPNFDNQEKRAIHMQRGFSRLMQIARYTYQLPRKDRQNRRRGGRYEIEECLRGNVGDPFPYLSQGARVLIAFSSTFFGMALAAWRIYRGWGLFDSPRRGTLFGVGLWVLECLISLLGRALAWP